MTENAVDLLCQDFTVQLPLPLQRLRNVYTNGFQSTIPTTSSLMPFYFLSSSFRRLYICRR
ncbi:hypothetical protein Bca4012_089931 [Brassica carinata]